MKGPESKALGLWQLYTHLTRRETACVQEGIMAKTPYILIGLFFVLGSSFVTACSAGLDAKTARRAIEEYFRTRHYDVVDMKIERIERNPLNERDYMAPKTFIVDVALITVRSMDRERETGAPEVAQPLTFRGARFRIRRTGRADTDWAVGEISGVEIP